MPFLWVFGFICTFHESDAAPPAPPVSFFFPFSKGVKEGGGASDSLRSLNVNANKSNVPNLIKRSYAHLLKAAVLHTRVPFGYIRVTAIQRIGVL